MPSRTIPAPAATKASAGKRFELPALEFKFASLTEGTDIPPPPPSPVKEVPTPPPTPPVGDKKEDASNGVEGDGKKANGAAKAQNTNGTSTAAGTKRPADDTPLSPALSSRQGSIRRLFSRTLLNNTYVEGEGHPNGNGVTNAGRPASRSNASVDEKKAKRGSGWFRRLRSGEPTAKRSSILIDEKKPAGPPPPMIPELRDLETTELAGDRFKNIK